MPRSDFIPLVLSLAVVISADGDAAFARSVSSSGDTLPLETAVRGLASRHGVDILFSTSLLRGLVTPVRPNGGNFPIALDQLLRGSGIRFKKNADGVYFLVKAPVNKNTAAPAVHEAMDDLPIVITARRRSELLEEAPLSVTAFGAQQIYARGARSLEDLLAYAPGVYFSQQGALRPGRVDGNVRFRGMIVNSGNPQEQLGCVFIDGVPMSGGLQSISFEDTERVEVINGPQSAIFGRSTFGGAINIVSRQPGDALAGRADSVITIDGDIDTSARVEGPVIPGVFAVALTVRGMRARGDYANPTDPGRRLGREQTVAAGASARLSLGDVNVTARVHYARDRDGAPAAWAFGRFEANCGPFGTGTRPSVCGDLPPVSQARFGQNTDNAAGVAATVQRNGGDVEFHSGLPTRYGLDREMWGASFRASLALPSANLVIETNGGYNRQHRTILADGDLGPDPVFIAAYPMRSTDTSLEVRVRSSVLTTFSWSLGSAYFDQRYRETAAALYPAFANPSNYAPACFAAPIDCDPKTRLKSSPEGDLYLGVFPYFIGHVTTKAVFGTADLKLSRAFEISVEGRREWDKVRDSSVATVGRAQHYRAWLFRTVVSAHPFERSTLYLSAANGNLPGSFNLRVNGASNRGREQLDALGAQDTLPQQKLLSLEAGAKLHFDKAMLRASPYVMRWRNQRIRQTFFDAGTNRIFSYYDASGSSKLSGLEVQGSWTPLPWLVLDATADLAVARYRSQTSIVSMQVLGNSDVSGNSLPASPKYSGSFAATVTGTTRGGSGWYARADAVYRARIFVDELNLTTLPSDVTANLRAGIRTGNVGVELLVTNLTQSRVPRFAAEQADISAYVPSFNLTYPGFITEAPPERKFGTRLSFKF